MLPAVRLLPSRNADAHQATETHSALYRGKRIARSARAGQPDDAVDRAMATMAIVRGGFARAWR
ncbi:methyltransferase FkbM [Burkholderia multivorans]|uniref:methyltransferase FkbM n=1 Tax=Burkholderia multivorans TaxID=87883 RepID=UPI00207D542E|nr:methyltransferase FkbM [Burkholderia multivorans]MCO1464724.1 methyltransferase FkbM [Burkholderia multivorans]